MTGTTSARRARPPTIAAEPTFDEKVAFLSHPPAYPAPVSRVDVVETHLSFVFLTDRDAWKIKKPVRLDGLDYGLLEARRRNGLNEIRLNRRLSTGVYRGLAKLVQRDDGSLSLATSGRVIDWLVRMRRLPADRMLDVLIRSGALTRADLAAVVGVLIRFYRHAPVPTLSGGEYRRTLRDTIGATAALLEPARYALPRDDVAAVAARLARYVERHAAMFDARVRHGRIVEAHGDLRPEHVCVEDPPQVIDCLEFSAALRIQDCVDELAFLAIECERLGAGPLRQPILSAYALVTGDAPSDGLVDFYQAYRALVRSRIAIRHLDDPDVRTPEKWRPQALDYLERARRLSARCA